MRNSKHGPKALVLAMMAAALGVMAFSAVGAQAETLPGLSTVGWFTVGGSKALAVKATATGEQVGAGSLLVPGRNLKLECKKGHVTGGVINSETDASGTVTFLECVSYDLKEETLLKSCVIPKGEITASALILPILHGGNEYVLFQPVPPATVFATVLYEKEMGCVLPHSNPVSGSIVAETSVLETVKPKHEGGEELPAPPLGLTFNPEIQLLSGDVLRFGAFPSYIHALATVKPTGAHLGQTIGVH